MKNLFKAAVVTACVASAVAAFAGGGDREKVNGKVKVRAVVREVPSVATVWATSSATKPGNIFLRKAGDGKIDYKNLSGAKWTGNLVVVGSDGKEFRWRGGGKGDDDSRGISAQLKKKLRAALTRARTGGESGQRTLVLRLQSDDDDDEVHEHSIHAQEGLLKLLPELKFGHKIIVNGKVVANGEEVDGVVSDLMAKVLLEASNHAAGHADDDDDDTDDDDDEMEGIGRLFDDLDLDDLVEDVIEDLNLGRLIETRVVRALEERVGERVGERAEEEMEEVEEQMEEVEEQEESDGEILDLIRDLRGELRELRGEVTDLKRQMKAAGLRLF